MATTLSLIAGVCLSIAANILTGTVGAGLRGWLFMAAGAAFWFCSYFWAEVYDAADRTEAGATCAEVGSQLKQSADLRLLHVKKWVVLLVLSVSAVSLVVGGTVLSGRGREAKPSAHPCHHHRCTGRGGDPWWR